MARPRKGKRRSDMVDTKKIGEVAKEAVYKIANIALDSVGDETENFVPALYTAVIMFSVAFWEMFYIFCRDLLKFYEEQAGGDTGEA